MDRPKQKTRLQRVVSRLAVKSNRLNSAEWSQALKVIGEQLDEEASQDAYQSETLEEINASKNRAYKRRKARN